MNASSEGSANSDDVVWIGDSTPVQWVKTQLREVAPTDLPVLLMGEPGSGRRLAARTVHRLGERATRPFVHVDCSQLPEACTEPELLGCPCTEDTASACGCVLQGGTLFLEEVDALSVDGQALLLEAMTTQRVLCRNLGEQVRTDVRIVAACHSDLGRMSRSGAFSAELYYRLALVPIKLPPLRERRRDIPALASHFVNQCAARMGRPQPALPAEVVAALLEHDWPGNVWELKRTLERAVVLATDNRIRLTDIQQPFGGHPQVVPPGSREGTFLFGLRYGQRGNPELN